MSVLLREVIARASTFIRMSNAKVQHHPLASSIFFGVTSKWSIDLIVQRSEHEMKLKGGERCNWQYDERRGASLALFGAAYLGVTQQQIYGRAFPCILARLAIEAPIARVMLQFFLDQLFVFPVVYFPLFYGIQGAVNPSTSCDSTFEGLSVGLSKCRENMWPDCTAAWTLWGPVQLANFAFVPRHWRAPFVSLTGFAWTAYLSTTRGSTSIT